jgi:2',3'-cyclic-nucleotide 2'-phosphodiesterase
MNLLYIGDIMGEPGIQAVQTVLPSLKQQHAIDLVIAQAENVTEGKGISVADFKKLKTLGIDFFTGGNWTTYRDEIRAYLNDPAQPIIRPANYPTGTPGLGWKYITTSEGPILVISLLGQIVGRDASNFMDNPLHVIDSILDENKTTKRAATIVNFHGEYSSEKRVIGYYLDGRVTGVIGDHWHVPTADAMVLPKGTAHITDVGMCGTLHSSLGVKLETIISRWKDNQKSKNELESSGPLQFNAVLIKSDPKNGLAATIRPINKILP